MHSSISWFLRIGEKIVTVTRANSYHVGREERGDLEQLHLISFHLSTPALHACLIDQPSSSSSLPHPSERAPLSQVGSYSDRSSPRIRPYLRLSWTPLELFASSQPISAQVPFPAYIPSSFSRVRVISCSLCRRTAYLPLVYHQLLTRNAPCHYSQFTTLSPHSALFLERLCQH